MDRRKQESPSSCRITMKCVEAQDDHGVVLYSASVIYLCTIAIMDFATGAMWPMRMKHTGRNGFPSTRFTSSCI
jgi:hypothetical protein